MKQTIKKAMSILLAVTFFFSSFALGILNVNQVGFAVEAEADETVISGACGVNLTYTLNLETGDFTINGTGEMYDYGVLASVPWYFSRSFIKKVIINEGVTSIDSPSFCDCENLTSIVIPKSVTKIGYGSFGGSLNLNNISVDENNKNYLSDGSSILFNKNKTEIICFPAGLEKTSYSIPESVMKIGDCAFQICTNLTSVTIHNNVTSIGSYAFDTCENLMNIIIPDSVNYIGNYAFQNCTELSFLHIPSEVSSIGLEILDDSSAYICSDTYDCLAKEYADENGIEFRLCDGNHSDNTPENLATTQPTTKPVTTLSTVPSTIRPTSAPTTTRPTEISTTKPAVTNPSTTRPAEDNTATTTQSQTDSSSDNGGGDSIVRVIIEFFENATMKIIGFFTWILDIITSGFESLSDLIA